MKRSRPDAGFDVVRDESRECPICLDVWESEGDHRICCLRNCGHLYGKSCIERALRIQSFCPTCKKPANLRDVIPLYFTEYPVVTDSSERDEALAKLSKSEKEVARLRIENEILRREKESFKTRAAAQAVAQQGKPRHPPSNHVPPPAAAAAAASSPGERLGSRSSGGCRAVPELLCLNNLQGARFVTFAPSGDMLLASCSLPTTSSSRPRHGVLKLSLAAWGGSRGSINEGQQQQQQQGKRHESFIPLHEAAVTDMAVQPEEGLLLTTSLDKKLVVTDHNDHRVLSYRLERPGRACIWGGAYSMYIGTENGVVLLYDLRVTGKCVDSFPKGAKGGPPVHSLAALQGGAVLAATYRSAHWWRRGGAEAESGVQGRAEEYSSGPVERTCTQRGGDADRQPVMSLVYQGGGGRGGDTVLLWSSRGNKPRHCLQYYRGPNGVGAATAGEAPIAEGGSPLGTARAELEIDGFSNKALLCRPSLLPATDSSLLLCGGDEESRRPFIWRVEAPSQDYTLPPDRDPHGFREADEAEDGAFSFPPEAELIHMLQPQRGGILSSSGFSSGPSSRQLLAFASGQDLSLYSLPFA